METKKKDLKKDEKGEMIVDIIIRVLVMVIFIMMGAELLSYGIQVMKVSSIADTVTREIELTGVAINDPHAHNTVKPLLDAYNSLLNTGDSIDSSDNKYQRLSQIRANIVPGSIKADPTYGSSDNANHLQWMTTFDVEVKANYRLVCFTFGGSQIPLDLPITVYKSGMSEVYWK